MADKKGRVNEVIRRNLSEIIIYELKNELTHYCSINGVFTTKDYSYCKVYVSHIDENKNENLVNFLNKRKGQIRSMLSKRLSIYKTPELIFVIDTNVINMNHIEKLVKEANESKMYTLKDYKNDQKKKLKNTYDHLLKDIKKSASKKVVKNNITKYNLKSKDLKSFVDKYEFLDIKEIELDKIYELNLLYFSIYLNNKKDLSSQVSFILENADYLLDKKLVDFISNYIFISSLKDNATTLTSFTIGSPLTKRLRYEILINYVNKLNIDRLLHLLNDEEEKVVIEMEVKLIDKLYTEDKNKVINFISTVSFNEKLLRGIIKKLTKNEFSKERDINILENLIS